MAGNRIRITVDHAELDTMLEKLTPKSKAESPVRYGAAAGAKVLYEALLGAVPVKSGTLKKSIYRYWGKGQATTEKSAYYVGVNMVKAPHWWLADQGHYVYKGQRVRPIKNGEFRTLGGTKRKTGLRAYHIPGRPYLQKTFDKATEEAREVALKEALGVIKKALGE